MMITTLNGGWTLRAVGGPVPGHVRDRDIPATVPGTVHTDLLSANLIPDPFDGANESALGWIGRSAWEYSREFELDPADHHRHDLVCDGLDTVAAVVVNETLVARTVNQHRSYRFDLRPYLVAGRNRIAVRFESALDYAERMEIVYGALPHTNDHPYNAIRKSACNFGWDWGIDAVTAGIWRDIRIESWSGIRITALSVVPDLVDGVGCLSVTAELDRSTSSDAEIVVEAGGTTSRLAVPARACTVTGVVDVPDADVWWPAGHGEQPLYEVRVTAGAEGGQHTVLRRVGFRSVRVGTAPDEHGSPFEVYVNDRLIMVRGANWIPGDAFVTRVTPERYARRLQDAVEANVNLLRVWGGGIYEDDAFYDRCDELGLLVWQDFLFACAAYSEREPMWSEIAAEAADAIRRLSPHPSLVIWNGNNENIWGYVDWNWRPRLDGEPWGDGYYHGLLPSLVERLDGRRPYSPGSPFSFDSYLHPNDPANGTVHIWDVWNTRDYRVYGEYSPRFVSEFGFQGPPALTTITSVVHDEPLDPYGPQMLGHQKANDGNGKLERGYRSHFPAPRSIEDWHWTTQLNQAHAVSYGIERFRSLAPLNSGMIVWQLNDNWPVISWAAVDYYGNRKPLWYAIRHAYAPTLATLQEAPDGVDLLVLNDADKRLVASGSVRRVDLSGLVLFEDRVELEVPARGVSRVRLGAGVLAGDRGNEALFCDIEGVERAVLYWADVVGQRLDPDALTAEWCTGDGSAHQVRVTATTVVRDLWLAADQLTPGARADSGLIQLLPGETHVFVVHGAENVDEAHVTAALWSANRLVSAPPGQEMPT